MKPNANLKVEINMKSIKEGLAVLRKAQATIYGLILVGVFGYSAFIINAAINVAPAATQSTIKALPKVTFDKATMDSLRNRDKVDASVPLDPGDHSLF
jgi:uncharacterized membrane protein